MKFSKFERKPIRAMRYHCLGNFEEAIKEAPNYVFPPGNLAAALMRVERYDKAITTIQQAQAQKLDSMLYRPVLFRIGLAQGNDALMQQQIAWGKGRLDELHTLNWQALAAAFAGRLHEADELTPRAVDLMEQRNLREAAAALLVDNASRQALAGNTSRVKANITQALSLSPAILTRGFRNVIVLPLGPMVFALNSELAPAQSWLDETVKQNATNSLSQTVWIPTTRAAIALRRGQTEKAIELLKSAEPYEAASSFWPSWLRGQAYLQAKKGNEAAAEFQRIIAHRGWEPISMLWPLAHLGLARAAVLNNDLATSRSEYERFLALWDKADPDLPLLLEVKKEYEKLKQQERR